MKKARFRQASWNAIKGMLGVAFMSLFFIFCHDMLLQNSYFNITSLELTGNIRLTKEQVLETAGIKTDSNILTVNLPLAKKYLLSHPWIAEADVSRELPGKLVLKIREHRPLAILDLNRRFMMNQEGKIFKEVSDSDAVELPVIEGLSFSDLDIGNVGRSASFDAVLSLLEIGLNPSSIVSNKQITKIQVDKKTGITIYAAGPILEVNVNSLRIGFKDIPEKLTRLEKILSFLKNNKMVHGIDWIDLDQINRVVVNPLI